MTAINRGQDYCKSSNNIALVPANGTFELTKLLSQASRCLRSIMPVGRKLIIHPLPADLCTMIISDSHWLLENVLCLVSNAIKYSDSGDVDLRIHISNDIQAAVVDATDTVMLRHSSKSTVSSQNRVVESDRMLVVTIEDHGVGVSEAMRETLFQPFRQAQRMAGGTGNTTILYRPLYDNLFLCLPQSTTSYSLSTIFLYSPVTIHLQDLGCSVC